MREMKALILVAGYATRLYPLTKNIAKPLLPINNRPMIDYIIDEINTIKEISEIFVVSNHKFAHQFFEWEQNKTNPIPITVLDDGTTTEENRRGAIGDIQFVIEECKIDDDLMVIAGDNFFTYKLEDYFQYFKNLYKDCVIVKKYTDVEALKSLGVAQVDKDFKVLDLEEKPQEPKSDLAVYATYMYRRDTVPLFKTYLDEGNKPDAPGYFVSWLYKKKDLYAYEMQGECYDVGTKEAYADVQKLFLNK